MNELIADQREGCRRVMVPACCDEPADAPRHVRCEYQSEHAWYITCHAYRAAETCRGGPYDHVHTGNDARNYPIPQHEYEPA